MRAEAGLVLSRNFCGEGKLPLMLSPCFMHLHSAGISNLQASKQGSMVVEWCPTSSSSVGAGDDQTRQQLRGVLSQQTQEVHTRRST